MIGVAQGLTNERGELVGIVSDYELARLRKLWSSMKDRCSNPKNTTYRYYGKRGIHVCERWQKSFKHFLEDVGPRPSGDHSLDRINSNGHYEPGNTRWATDQQQAENRRKPMFTVEAYGVEEAIRLFKEADARRSPLAKRNGPAEDASPTPPSGAKS